MADEELELGRVAGRFVSRRECLQGLKILSVGAAVALCLPRGLRAAAAAAEAGAGTVRIEVFSPAGRSLGVQTLPKVVKTEAEWRAQLTPISFQITRRAGTERADLSDHAHPDGLYHCICCETALYDSRTKFDSGTGWPSFYQPISKLNVVESRDDSFGMERIAVSCRRCDAHLGHVFDDGPPPTGLRYCMNAVAMHFVPRAA